MREVKEESREERELRNEGRFATDNIRFFVGFFFVFMPIPIFVLAFIAAQTAVAALSLRVFHEFFTVIGFRASSASILSATCYFVRSLLRE